MKFKKYYLSSVVIEIRRALSFEAAFIGREHGV